MPKIPLHKVRPDPEQPRKTFEEARIVELAMSIKDNSLLNPITVQKDAVEDIYNILAGERRWRAYCWLEKNFPDDTRWIQIPSRIPDPSQADDFDPQIAAAIENMQREDIPPFEEGEYLLKLVERFGSVKKLAKRLNKSEDRLNTVIALVTKATPEVQEAIRNGSIHLSHWRVLKKIHNPILENKALKKVLSGSFKNHHDLDKTILFARQQMENNTEIAMALIADVNFTVDHAKLLVDVQDRATRLKLFKEVKRNNWDASRLFHEILIVKNPIHVKKQEEEEKAVNASDYILQLAREASALTDKLDPNVIPYLTKTQREFVTTQFRRLSSALAEFRYQLDEAKKIPRLRVVGGKGDGK